MQLWKCFFCVQLLLLVTPTWAETQVWLLGGGPALEASQAQIEANVRWVREVIQRLPGERSTHVYFNDGDHPNPDVLEWRPVAESADTLQPLARVYDSYLANGEHYRNHRIEAVEGGTERSQLVPALEAARRALSPGEPFWLVFNGHGSEGERPAENTLELWNYTAITVTELAQILSQGPADAPTRFILTQCYAGGFARLIYHNAEPDQGMSEYQRCGFMAVAEHQPAEGCSAVLEVGSYQDYSTFFFAALAGRARTGEPLAFDPDGNADGQITPYEAHLYALRAARSSDMPRSTSEDYLLRWMPWYARWWPLQGEWSQYGQLAQGLMQDLGIETLQPALAQRRQAMLQQRQPLALARKERKTEIGTLRDPIRYALEARWPAVAVSHTLAYKRFLEQDLDQAQAFILQQPEYAPLVAAQQGYWALMNAEVELDRALTQLDRIEHLLQLDRLVRLFAARANAREQREYQRLLHCEQAMF